MNYCKMLPRDLRLKPELSLLLFVSAALVVVAIVIVADGGFFFAQQQQQKVDADVVAVAGRKSFS